MPATLPDQPTNARARTYPAETAQRVVDRAGFIRSEVSYGATTTRVMVPHGPSAPAEQRPDALSVLAVKIGPRPGGWRSDTADEIAERREITDSLASAQMESIARRDAQ